MQSRMLRDLDMSSKPLCMLLLLVILFNHGMLSEGGRHILESKYYPKEFPSKIIKTITMDDGDIYDCKKIHSQPSKRRISISKRKKQTSDKLRDSRIAESGTEGESCPPGSFPVLKATKAGPLNFSALQDFASSRARSFLKSKAMKTLAIDNLADHEYAKGMVSGTYGGGEATFSVWGPNIEDRSEMSLSQVWVVHISQHQIYMALEAGWMVNPSVFGDARTRFFIFTTVNPSIYGDRRTRFFIFTTNDGYTTWLYNDNHRSETPNNRLQFRIMDDYLPMGIQLDSSTINGDRTELEIVIKQDEDQDWGLWVDDNQIGYWPKSNYRARSANTIEWGGEIVNKQTRGRHTSTQMGNGRFSSEPIGRVAYIRNMALYDLDLDRYHAPGDINGVVTKPNCYDLRYSHSDDEYGEYITFGGPGYDRRKCP